MNTSTIARTYDQAQHLLAPDISDVDAQLSGTRLRRRYPLTGEWVWGTIQFVDISPYVAEEAQGIARAYWVADGYLCSEYIRLDDLGDDLHDQEYEDWLDSLWDDEREARREVARCRADDARDER